MVVHNSAALRQSAHVVVPAQRKQWTNAQFELVFEGLRAKKSYSEIAKIVSEDEEGRPNITGNNVYDILKKQYSGIEKFLREWGLTDAVEMEELLTHYTRSSKTSSRHSGVEHWAPKQRSVSKKPRRFADDPVAERSTLVQLIAEGIKAQQSFATIVESAEKDQIPTDAKAIQKIIDAYRGIAGFLEHAGHSRLEANQIAQRYEQT